MELALLPVRWHVGISLVPEIDLRHERLLRFYRAVHDAHPSIFNKAVQLEEGVPLLVAGEPSRPVDEPVCVVTADSVQFNVLSPEEGDRGTAVEITKLLCEQAHAHFDDLARISRVGKVADFIWTLRPEDGSAADVVRRAMTTFGEADGIEGVLLRVVMRRMGRNINVLLETRVPLAGSGLPVEQEERIRQTIRVQCDVNNADVSGSVSAEEAADIVKFADQWVESELAHFIMRRVRGVKQ